MKKIQLPPLDADSAYAMVKNLEEVCNTTNPSDIVLLFSEEILWKNTDSIVEGRKAIGDFLIDKWKKELNYCIVKELLSYDGRRIATRSEAEWMCAKTRQWFRTCQNEYWEVDDQGLIIKMEIRANDTVILERQRKYRR